MGIGDDSTTASRLRLLQDEFIQPAQNREPGARTAPTATASAPLNLAIVDHIRSAIDEVIAHARVDMPETHPDATPAPADPADLYGWWKSIPVSDEDQQTARDQVIYRQGLEHAILMGNTKVVRPLRCPECECLGLLWVDARRKAVCTNLDCVDDNGLSNAWTLKRLAYERIAAERMLKRRAT